MIKYNWQKIYNRSEGRPIRIIEILDYIVHRPIPKSNYDTDVYNLSQIDWAGDSFIINPEPIIQYKYIIPTKDLAEYVALASFRSLAEYLVTKRKTLRATECPVSLESIENNKLLTIANNEIYFRWEEATH